MATHLRQLNNRIGPRAVLFLLNILIFSAPSPLVYETYTVNKSFVKSRHLDRSICLGGDFCKLIYLCDEFFLWYRHTGRLICVIYPGVEKNKTFNSAGSPPKFVYSKLNCVFSYFLQMDLFPAHFSVAHYSILAKILENLAIPQKSSFLFVNSITFSFFMEECFFWQWKH